MGESLQSKANHHRHGHVKTLKAFKLICMLWLFTFHVMKGLTWQMPSIPSQENPRNASQVFVASKKLPRTKVRATSGWLAGLFLVFIFLSHMMVSLGLGGKGKDDSGGDSSNRKSWSAACTTNYPTKVERWKELQLRGSPSQDNQQDIV